jgi:hypothetical protein
MKIALTVRCKLNGAWGSCQQAAGLLFLLVAAHMVLGTFDNRLFTGPSRTTSRAEIQAPYNASCTSNDPIPIDFDPYIYLEYHPDVKQLLFEQNATDIYASARQYYAQHRCTRRAAYKKIEVIVA